MSQQSILKKFRVETVLTDATACTYGVTRNDTSGVVVAAGTTTPHIGTGLYQPVWTEPAYDLVYTVTVIFTYAGQTITQTDVVTGTSTPATSTSTGFTIDEIRQRCAEFFGLDTPLTGIPGAVNQVMEIIRGKGDWSFWKLASTITLSASYDTGTVAATLGSTTVTGTSTVWVSGHAGMKIRIGGGEEYTISSVNTGAQTLVLDHAYAETTDTGLDYEIYQDTYSLPAACDSVDRVWDATNKVRLVPVAPIAFKSANVYANATQDSPLQYAVWGLDSSGYTQLLFYPAPSEVATIVVWYKKRPTAVARSSPSASPDLPAHMHELVLQGVIWKMAQRAQGMGQYGYWKDERNLFYSMLDDRWRQDMTERDFKVRLSNSSAARYWLDEEIVSIDDLTGKLLLESGGYIMNEYGGRILLEG
jgi:hypothetical protein